MTKSKNSGRPAAKTRVDGPRWPLAVAKSRLSEIIRLAREEGPQIITSHGHDVAYVTVPPLKPKVSESPRTGMEIVTASLPYRATVDADPELDASFQTSSYLPENP